MKSQSVYSTGNSALRINGEAQEWLSPKGMPRRAGCELVGFGGAYAHVVIEEGPEQILSTQHTKPYYLITLSAKHPDSLAQTVGDLKAFLDSRLRGNDCGVGDGVGGLIEAISYTLNTGRSHFNYRLALVVSSLEDLKNKLAEAQTQIK